ncbi:DUF2380 domain-containing protein [Methylobacterium sp. AMS5]|nr:DUF2380 domain-containing protein [Methylobacterium sp. AMS5]AMB47430.1 hypothetical protein Y590_20988 [Methylobacterium sp. AMS5]
MSGTYGARWGAQLAAAGLILAAAPSAPCAEPRPTTLAILPLKLLDTSGEPIDQGPEHARRLAVMAQDLAADLGSDGSYRTLRLASETLRTRCPGEHPECLLAAAREADASLVFVGVVHKSSTLILQIFARVVDTHTGHAVLTRDLNFRGDTDEAWHRA